MALFKKNKMTHPIKARQETTRGGPEHGGSIGGATGGNTDARGVPGAIVTSSASLLGSRNQAVDQALTHPSVIAPVFFFATEFGRMPYQLKSGEELYSGDTPTWLEKPLPRNPSYPWRRLQRDVGFELELFGACGLRIQLSEGSDGDILDEGGDFMVESVRPISPRRYVSLGDIDDPQYIIFTPDINVASGTNILKRQKKFNQHEVLSSEPNDDGVLFLQVSTMSTPNSIEGISPYMMASDAIQDASLARLQKTRFWQRDGRKHLAVKGIDDKKDIAGDEWETTKKAYKKALKIQKDNPADVPLFSKEGIDILDLGDTMKNAQGAEFAEYYSSQMAMLGRIPEMLIRMGHRSNPNYKIIRAIYQHFISSRVAPALNDFAAILQILMPNGAEIDFDLTSALRADLETLVNTFRQAKPLAVWSPNDMLELSGFERINEEGMDERYSDIQTIPISRIADFADSVIEKNYGLGAKSEARAKSY